MHLLIKRIPLVFICVLCVLCLSSIALAKEGGQKKASAAKPNVILIVTDDQGYGDLSVHGNPVLKTPKLDALHAESIRFTDFHVAPMCTPTRGELMTGIDAFRNGATAVCEGRSLPRRELPMMPQFFKKNGYATGHFGKWHLGDNYPYRPRDRGFDESIHNCAWGIGSLAEYWENDAFDDCYWHNNELKRFEGYNTDVFFAEAMAWIEKQKDQPFFLYLPTTAAHSPFVVPEQYAAPYQDQPGAVASFFGMIANIDENVAGLDRFLEEKGLKENTIFIFMTDNGTVKGDTVFNAGMRGKKTSEYDGGHRVPFFLRWPAGGYDEGRDIDALAHSTDLLPTLIDLCGLETAPKGEAFTGHSLRPLLEGDEDALDDRKVVIQYKAEFNKWRGAVLWKKWRLVNGSELHDVTADPGQTRNLYDQHPEVVQTIRAHYEQWVEDTEPIMNQTNFVSVGVPQEKITWLSSCNWTGSYADNWGNLASQKVPGYWSLQVEKGGNYRVSMYMFHPETNAPLNGGLKQVRPRPVTQARLLVTGEGTTTVPVEPEDTHVTFDISLKKGEQVKLEGRFLDKDGKVLSGAFYTFVQKVEPDAEPLPVIEYVSVDGVPRTYQPPASAPNPRASAREKANNQKIPRDALLIADFEGETHGDWKTTGDAFGESPYSAKQRVSGHRGKQLIDTFLLNRSDKPTGTLTSPPFTIARSHLNFLIGGGKHSAKTCVNLLIDGKTVQTAVGSATKDAQGRKIMEWVSWDLTKWKGKEAQLVIVDKASGGWGHIMVDHVFQSDLAMAGKPARPRKAKPAGKANPASRIQEQRSAGSARPNILIIFTDDQGYGDVGCYGNEKIKTPNLDQLAAGGTRFTSFYSQNVCGPARSALLTGRYPSRSKGWSMPADEITWAELMKPAGYETICIGKWDVSNRKPIIERMPNAQGFDYYFGPLGANDNGVVKFHENNEPAGSTKDMGSLTRLYTDKAIHFLEKRKDGDKPFVLYVAHTMMHTIIDASPAFRGKSEGDLYGDVVEEFDHETGRLLDTLDQLSLADDTLVIYTSDNGPWNQPAYTEKKKGHPAGSIFWGSPGELRGGKGSAYEAGSRVPCIVRWPGKVPAGRVSDAIFSTLDFLPTFAHLAGFQIPNDRPIDGHDQSDLLFGKSEKGARETFIYDHVIAQGVGIRKGKWKLLLPGRAPEKPHRFLMDFGSNDYELYDLDADIGETTNLAGQRPERVMELKALLEDKRVMPAEYR